MLPTSGQDSFCWSNVVSLGLGSEKEWRGHNICCVEAGLYRGCLRVRPFKYSYQRVSNYLLCGKGATSAPKSAEGALRGWESTPHCTPSTIRQYCAHHSWRYFSHPDEEGERQFRFAPFGHSWKKASARGSVGAQLTIQSRPSTHLLAKESAGRRISAQRGVRRATTTYSALQRPHTTTVQSGPVWKKILSPLQMDTPYEI